MKKLDEVFQQAAPITPSFPNWQRSFVSGANSSLFKVEHRLSSDAGVAKSPFLLSKTAFKNQSEGPPGHVHGGASAGLIDEVMGILVWNQNYPCVTQTLTLNYMKPVPIDLEAYLLTELTKISERRIEVICTLFEKEKTPYVQAVGVFHRLTQEQLQRFAVQYSG